MRSLVLIIICILLSACKNDLTVKPAAMLRLDYPMPEYQMRDFDCPYSFEVNQLASIEKKEGCGVNLNYTRMNATVFLTYQKVKGDNLDSLLYDAQKLTYDHNIKADAIFEQPRVDSINKVYGMFYMIEGNAATQSQFYVTDSINHFITGAAYFETKPNFDSIFPAVVYLRDDMRRIMETIVWEK